MKSWFPSGGIWHAILEGKKAHCGFEPLVAPSNVVEAPDDEVPPNPCRRCLLAWLLNEVEEEPLEHARARGYLPVELDESDD